ncbi:MAG: two-component system, sensor histidine kinase and response regulator [Actinoplanes sp.]|nr:two-component system, sensor histidine kinase and response regulator [Actinoplanes sp.]
MALHWALVGNIVIACAYTAITVAIVVQVGRAGQLRADKPAVATALIIVSLAVGHGLHALIYAQADQVHDVGAVFVGSAVWDVLTASVGVCYWTLRRGFRVLLGGTGARFVDPAEHHGRHDIDGREQHRRHDIDVREHLAEPHADEAEHEAEAYAQSAVDIHHAGTALLAGANDVLDLSTTEPAAGAAGAVKGTVLLVEDNDINQMVAIGILTRLGYTVDVAGDGQVALERAARRHYDAILMDCRMPRMDGFTATAHLRAREAVGAGHTPIIAMTASALVADRERCLAAGMDDFLSKTVNPDELAAALQQWITCSPPTDASAAGEPPAAPNLPVIAAMPAVAAALRRPAPAATPATGDGDPIGERLRELGGGHSETERALVHRLVTSFLARAPQQLTAITDAVAADDLRTVADQAHSLTGAAGTIGAAGLRQLCERIEDDARAGRRTAPAVLHRLRTELDQVEQRLRAATTV